MDSKRKRRFAPGYLLGLSVTAVLLALPAVAASQSTRSLEQRVAKMERMLDSGTLLQLLQSVEALQSEVRELRGQLEQQQNSLSQVTVRQRELYLDVDRRLQRMGAGGVAAGAASGGVAVGGPGTAPSIGSGAPAASTAGASSTASTGATATAAAGAGTQGQRRQAGGHGGRGAARRPEHAAEGQCRQGDGALR